MKRRHFLGAAGAAGALLQERRAAAQTAPAPVEIHPGVWKFSFGNAEEITPAKTRRYAPAEAGLKELPVVAACPVTVRGSGSRRGYLLRIPLAPNEIVYGLGLQLQSLIQRGLKKKLRVNADPKMDTGDSHAPVPFYVTTAGYGVLVDTARYTTFYCGNKKRVRAARSESERSAIEIPVAEGADVYVFGGPTLREAVQRYNLFSGGGPLPPRWGLGMWYRAKSDYQQAELIGLADEFRERRIPCDVIGLEPGWQTHSYSCSYVWSKNYPNPAGMLSEMAKRNYHVNLWEHAFTHPTSPIYQALREHSGDFEVWDGLVPDFLQPEARRIFADYHERTLIAPGVSGFKLDECDNSDFTGNWSFPEIARFPSGADGEQMHCLFGLRYQDTLQEVFEKRGYRTYGLVRNSGALAAPYPYVLYSDLYDHKQFIRGLVDVGLLRAAVDSRIAGRERPRRSSAAAAIGGALADGADQRLVHQESAMEAGGACGEQRRPAGARVGRGRGEMPQRDGAAHAADSVPARGIRGVSPARAAAIPGSGDGLSGRPCRTADRRSVHDGPVDPGGAGFRGRAFARRVFAGRRLVRFLERKALLR